VTTSSIRAGLGMGLAALLCATALVAAAPDEEATAAAPDIVQAPVADLSDTADLEAFIDGMMAAHMPSRKIPAATIAIVKDGELLFAKGYGFADRETRTPVEADRTLFRPGSISKLFTWTAVMQLAERGQLDLDADVNTYLKTFQIPATYPEPVTMKNLLTHTPGFEEGAVGYLFVKDASGLIPMREALAAHIPERVRPPGTWASYSNWGAALAGLIVENVSGMPFADYIDKNIFQPLDMKRSTFKEPLPENLAPDMEVSYRRKNGRYMPEPFEFISNFGPAGSLSSTATDMAHFMIAHLQLGRYGDHRILEEDTARRMHSQLYTADPRLPGMDYGFYQSDIYGQHAIGHGGDTIYFHSDLALFPAHDVGLFVSYATHGGRARVELVEAFVKRYFGTDEPELPKPPEDFTTTGAKYAGKYRFTRHNWSDLEKVMALPSVISVAITPDGELMTAGGISEEPQYWVEVQPGYFRQVDGYLSLAFKEDEHGKVTHLIFSNAPFMPTYRIAWYTTPAFSYFLLGVALVLCLTTLVSVWRQRKTRKQDPAGARWAVRLAGAVSALTLLFAVAVVVIISVAGEDLFFGYPPSLTAALMLPIITSILTLGVVALAVVSWRKGYWTRFRRVHYTLFTVFAVGLVWFYWFWNILGVQYG